MKRRLRPVSDIRLGQTLSGFTARLRQLREAGFSDSKVVEAFRQRARAAKLAYLERAGFWLGLLCDRLEASGVRVHLAGDAQEACRMVLDICKRAGASRVVKGKSMTCDEIGLNPALEAGGLTVTETDLGEFIIQQFAEPPFHILGPAMHKTRQEIGQMMRSRFGVQVSDDPQELTQAARRILRRRFLEAEVGISGVNAAACTTGTLAVISNEGNGRYCTTLPPVHIAVMGLEKAVPTLDDLALFSTLIPRAAMGWKMSMYVSWLSGPAGQKGGAGPKEMHLVIVDNGRSRILSGPYWEILLCLRCSTCLNYCPVYALAGGHAYGGVYPGPMGSVLGPLLPGGPSDLPLVHASTLCGLCREKCPMGIDLPGMLLKARQARPALGGVLLPALAAEILSHRPLFEAACRLARPAFLALDSVAESPRWPGPVGAWRRGRRLPKVPGRTWVGGLKKRGGDDE